MATVGLGYPPKMRMTVKNVGRAVGGGGVDHNVFGSDAALTLYAEYCVFQVAGAVEGRGDDGDAWE